jgi:N-acetyl-anhydromuramyl-L-alanine amidase AmpD
MSEMLPVDLSPESAVDHDSTRADIVRRDRTTGIVAGVEAANVHLIEQVMARVTQAGIHVIYSPGWASRGRPYAFSPQGVVQHHTGGRNDLKVVESGRPDLSGPLSNWWTSRSGVVNVVAAGYCNHAGSGGPYKTIPADGANKYMWGHEVENDGNEEFPAVQMHAIDVLEAAAMHVLGKDSSWVIGHLEWAPGRKVDPNAHFLPMAAQRSRIAHLLNPPQDASPLLRVGSSGSKVADVQRALDSLLGPTGKPNQTAKKDGVGKFGKETYRVLCVFQSHTPRHDYPHKLKVTGTVDLPTWAALRAVAHPAKKG